MAPIYYIVPLLLVLLAIYCIRYYKKHGTLGVPTDVPLQNKTNVYDNTPQEIRLSTPEALEIIKLRADMGVQNSSRFQLAGAHTDNARKHFSESVKKYQRVELVPEPENRVNTKALKVMMGRKKLGYVPTAMLDKIWPIYEKGKHLAFIHSIDWTKEDMSNTPDEKYLVDWLTVNMTVEY